MLSPVDQIKERLSIVDIVSSYIKLEKAGMNLKARCPFHNEKTASFLVSPSRNNYHCFGCNRGGDIFTFVEDIEGVQFAEALKILAERAGVTLDKLNGKQNQSNKKSYEALELAAKFFEFNLEKNPAALEYLKGRGLEEKTIKDFRIGYALNGWENLTKFLKSRGFSESVIEESGLSIKGKSGQYDRFRSRIMFPIADSQGRIVAFTGRIFPEPEKKEETAKYINSPETDLYNKSKILYGYDKAKRSMMTENSVVIVEGQMDLILAHQAGTTNTVAVSGTALTLDHLNLIKRFTDKVLFAFDMDQAGLKAGERGVKVALSLGMDVRMITLPAGLDPADFILKDKEKWEQSLKEAKHIVDFSMDYIASLDLPLREFRLEVCKKVLPYIYWISNSIDQAHFTKEIARRLDLSEEAVRLEIEKAISSQEKEKVTEVKEEVLSKVAFKNTGRQMEDKIFGIYIWQSEVKDSLINNTDLKKRFQQITDKDLEAEINSLEDAQKQDLVFQAEMYYQNEDNLKDEVEELLDNFEKESLEEKLTVLMEQMRNAENKKDEARAEEIFKKCHIISGKINEIKNRRFLEK